MLTQIQKFTKKIDFRWNEQEGMRTLIALGAFFAVLVAYHFQVLQRFELVTYDYRFLLKQKQAVDPRIVVIEISDDSVSKIGRWPWERSWHAALIQALKEWGAKAIVFDVIFSETSDIKNDTALAQALSRAGNVYLAQFLESARRGKEPKILTSLPQFTQYAYGQGHINLEPDIDGTMRRIPLFIQYNSQSVPQLSLAVAADEWGASLKDLHLQGHAAFLPLPDGKELRIPLDRKNNLIIQWVGKWADVFKHYSYIDVVTSYAAEKKGLATTVSPEAFKGKICFVGTSAAGLFDIRPTPLEPSYPAVGVNLTVLNSLLKHKFISVSSQTQNIVILFLLTAILSALMQMQNFIKTAICTVGIAAAYLLAAILFFVYANIWINIVYSLILIFLIYFFVTLYNQLSVTIERSKLLKLATRDSLTGLFNIGHFKLLFKAEMSTLPLRRNKTLSLLMADVDNFKRTNDVYGHVTGDEVLREVAGIMKSNCRALDVVGRYGGEEFIIMLPGANSEEAFKVAEKIRKGVEGKFYFHSKGDFATSISVGVTEVGPQDKDMNEVIARADRALYEAKAAGKNKAVISAETPKVRLVDPYIKPPN